MRLTGIFQRLLGLKPANPTLGFPPRPPSFRLTWNTDTHRLNGIPLGASLEDLIPLGSCDKYQVFNKQFAVLSYLSLGLDLSIGFNGLNYINFFLSEDPMDGPIPGMRYARPTIEPGGFVLTPEVTPQTLSGHFGRSEPGDQSEEELVVIFRDRTIIYEVCVSKSGLLTGIDIYDPDR